MLIRVRQAACANRVVVATSDRADDGPIRDYCASRNVACVTGNLNNVAQRIAAVFDLYPADAYVRLCGDSPFIDPAILDAVTNLYTRNTPDLATNVHPRTFPKGLSVEVLNPCTFRGICPELSDPQDMEHVTRYLYRNASRFTIDNYRNATPFSCQDMSIDTLAQWNRFTAFAEKAGSNWHRLKWPEIDRILSAIPINSEKR